MTDSNRLRSLNQLHAIPGVAQIVSGNGELPKIEITTPEASSDIYLHGAHLTSWIPEGMTEAIFLSSESKFESGKAIRGGIPICFPWFGPKAGPKSDQIPGEPKAPQHGFARTSDWQLDCIQQTPNAVEVILSLCSSETTRQAWPHDFHASYRITIGQQLKLELVVTNSGSSPFTFEEAFHTYYRVADAAQIKISGLNQVQYLDNLENKTEKQQTGDIRMAEPIDNIYLDTTHDLLLDDLSAHRQIQLQKHHSHNTVIWNPGLAGTSAFTDMADEEWQQMACIEASNVRDRAVFLAPGQFHSMSAVTTVLPA